MQRAEDIIHKEHRNLFSVLNCLRGMARDALAGGKPIDAAILRQAFSYVDKFLNRYHHPKESAHLFAALRKRRPDLGGKLDELDGQHKGLPEKLTVVSEALDRYEADPAGELAAFCEVLEDYCRFELGHMRMEEAEIIPAARDSLTDEDWKAISAAFEDNDDPLFGERQSSELRDLFRALVNEMPAPHGLGNPAR
ncbi:MAG: hemerythrin domain-containing protein [Rhodospirillales bacterium]|nr:hemerythrin domain-containing protein [Rhodospirillales bacterium]